VGDDHDGVGALGVGGGDRAIEGGLGRVEDEALEAAGHGRTRGALGGDADDADAKAAALDEDRGAEAGVLRAGGDAHVGREVRDAGGSAVGLEGVAIEIVFVVAEGGRDVAHARHRLRHGEAVEERGDGGAREVVAAGEEDRRAVLAGGARRRRRREGARGGDGRRGVSGLRRDDERGEEGRARGAVALVGDPAGESLGGAAAGLFALAVAEEPAVLVGGVEDRDDARGARGRGGGRGDGRRPVRRARRGLGAAAGDDEREGGE
jgi:hypothetical protein